MADSLGKATDVGGEQSALFVFDPKRQLLHEEGEEWVSPWAATEEPEQLNPATSYELGGFLVHCVVPKSH